MFVCVCEEEGGGMKATKLVTEPRTSPLLDLCPWQMQSLPFVRKVCVRACVRVCVCERTRVLQ